ncbi:MAG: putative Histidine kinase [Nitrospira sp.]|nr:putative Histidine kinase [Nitrospira sp.]
MRPARRAGGLQRKLFVALLIVGIVPGIAALWTTYYFSTASLKQAIGESFQEIARSTAIRLATAVDNEIDRAIRLALVPVHVRQPVMRANERANRTFEAAPRNPSSAASKRGEDTSSSTAATVRYLKEWARESGHYVRVTVADQQGAVVASTDPLLPPQQTEQVWWREAMRAVPGTYYISSLGPDAQANDMTFQVAVPILDDVQGTPIGAVELVIRRNVLTQMILPIHIGNTGHGMLLDTQGTPLICPVLPPTAHLIPHTLLSRLTMDHPLWLVAEDDAHGGRAAIVGAAPVRFSHQLTASSLGGDRWYAFIRQAPEETYAPIYSLLVTVGMIGFGLVFVLSAFGFVVGYRFVKPLKTLQREAEGLRHTLTMPPQGGSRPHIIPTLRVDARKGDEIEDLATSFAAMREVLEENLRTIRSQQHELIRQEKLASVGQLLAALAHDLRNPLGVIRSSAQVVLDGPPEERIRQEMARYIIDEVDKLSHRIHDFLRYARQKPPDQQVVAAEEVMRAAQRQWEAQGGHEHIRVEQRFGQNLHSIRVDPEQVKEALMNLLINAREAMLEGGTLTLTTRRGTQGDVELEVTDSGSGIAADHLSRIFEPFFTTKEYGTGLGLTNVKRLVEDNGGSLAVTSRLGEGTSCTLRFRPVTWSP